MSRDYEGYVPADAPRPGLRADLQPHRGQTILVLGILSLFMAHFILGPMAWIMGRNDLKEMDAGRMDPSGRDNTKTGTVCGMISTILAMVSVGMIFIFFLFCMGLGAVGTIGAGSQSARPQAVPQATLRGTEANPAPTRLFDPADARPSNIVVCKHCNEVLECSTDYAEDGHFRCAKCNRVFKGD